VVLSFILLMSLSECTTTRYSPYLSKIVKYVKAGMRHVRDGKYFIFSEIIVVLLTFFLIFKSIFFIKNSKSQSNGLNY